MEPRFIPTQQKIQFIDAISRSGLLEIEATSFTSPRAIPNLADAEQVMKEIQRVKGVKYGALVPNSKGVERSLRCGVDVINVVLSASESHNLANLRMTRAKSISEISVIANATHGSAAINASIATAFGCPFEGEVPVAEIYRLIENLAAANIRTITLSDTTGMANPVQVRNIYISMMTRWPEIVFRAHFHDTRAMGLANAVAALEAGVIHFDASLGGLGGCPYAPGASGNVCTEDLVHMFELMGCSTNINLSTLLDLAKELEVIVGHEVTGKLIKAGPCSRRYSLPDGVAARTERVELSSVEYRI